MPYSWSLMFLFFVPFKFTSSGVIALVFILLIRFLLDSFLSSSFLVLMRYSFLIFSFISTCLVASATKMPKYLYGSSYLPNPSARAGYDTRSIFKRSFTGLNSEFSFSQTSGLTKAEESRLSYNLPIAEGRIIGFIPFPRVLVLCEMQSVSSRI